MPPTSPTAYSDAGLTAKGDRAAGGNARRCGRRSSGPTTPTRSRAAATSPWPTSVGRRSEAVEAARGDAEVAGGEARARSPRRDLQPREPCLGLSTAGRIAEAIPCSSRAEADGSEARARPPRHAQEPQPPRHGLLVSRSARPLGPLFEEMLEHRGPSSGRPSRHARTETTLGANYAGAGRISEAIALLESALQADGSELGPDHPDTMSTRESSP